MAKRLIPIIAFCAMVAPVSATACDMAKAPKPTTQDNEARAKLLLSTATLVVDGEVIEPETMTTPAKIKVVRTFRGPKVAYFLSKGDDGACLDMFMTKGERRRFVMVGGPGVYRTSTFEVSSERAVDRMLGSDRRKDWPAFYPKLAHVRTEP